MRAGISDRRYDEKSEWMNNLKSEWNLEEISEDKHRRNVRTLVGMDVFQNLYR